MRQQSMYLRIKIVWKERERYENAGDRQHRHPDETGEAEENSENRRNTVEGNRIAAPRQLSVVQRGTGYDENAFSDVSIGTD